MADTQKTPQDTREQAQPQKDEDALPTPADKHQNYEADRKRLAEEHGQT